MSNQESPRLRQEIVVLQMQLIRLWHEGRRDQHAHLVRTNLSILPLLLSQLGLWARRAIRAVQAERLQRRLRELGNQPELPNVPGLREPGASPYPSAPVAYHVRSGL